MHEVGRALQIGDQRSKPGHEVQITVVGAEGEIGDIAREVIEILARSPNDIAGPASRMSRDYIAASVERNRSYGLDVVSETRQKHEDDGQGPFEASALKVHPHGTGDEKRTIQRGCQGTVEPIE